MAPAQFNLGYALEEMGRLDEALQAYRKAMAIAPQLAEAHNNLGNVLQKLKRYAEALEAYDNALSLKPETSEYHMNRGDALRDLERLDEAVTAYEAAIRHKPRLAEAYVNLAYVLRLQGCSDTSVQAFQQAIGIRPDYFDAYMGMGHVLRRLDRHDEAVAAFRHALELRPDDPMVLTELRASLKEGCHFEVALALLQQALASKSDYSPAIDQMAGILLDMGRHEEALETYQRALTVDSEGLFRMYSNLLMALNYQAEGAPQRILAEARAFGAKAACKAVPFSHHGNAPILDRRLRIGLVSGDLGQHPVGYFLQNVLENLDLDELELFVYETSERKDALNERLRRAVHQWRSANIATMNDEAVAKQIRVDGIDILLDLAGHTAKNRLPAFAWKPAPIQVSWLGYFATTGLDSIDYILADPWVLLAGEEVHFVERPWRLPDAHYCFSPPDEVVDVAPLLASETGMVTFGCFNNPNKLNPKEIACWVKVLNVVANSQLFLKYKGYEGVTLVRQISEQFARFGIAPERLKFEGKSSRDEYLAAYHRVDIALDPFPYPGGTTSIEGLWMGVPVLSMKGDRFISHQGETILHNVGLPEWIAADEDDYVAKAAAFAGDTQALAALRAGLRERLLASPLCDAPRFARNFEDAMRGMWQIWCEQQKQAQVTSK